MFTTAQYCHHDGEAICVPPLSLLALALFLNCCVFDGKNQTSDK